MSRDLLEAERKHLSNLLEAIQRCVFFLHESESKHLWPIDGAQLAGRKKDVALFESLAAINERFAKLQDTLAAAMRHSALLMGEPTDSFLRVLALFEKLGVIDSTSDWQRSRAARNLAAHDYETDYDDIAEHFNALHELTAMLYAAARRLTDTCSQTLQIQPVSADFSTEFARITAQWGTRIG
ncbi:hypothetical protein [Aromatoleum evansii]|uniref:hypothetical protein n=1 Tax=Aromatoleum evansii TaxID=59406 RepID=UPI00145CA98B|nr:hypothetical protein [Aromatoleum evansii]NMG29016.1 hypothetical protein [Aromatoleum evansii]